MKSRNRSPSVVRGLVAASGAFLLLACGGTTAPSGQEAEAPRSFGRCKVDSDCPYPGERCEAGTCRGLPSNPADPCSISQPSTSEEALAAIAACPLGLAEDAVLTLFWSNLAGGAMGITGRSLTWTVRLESASTREVTRVSVTSAVTAEIFPLEDQCLRPVEPLRSSIVVPDTVERVLRKESVYDNLNLFIRQECESPVQDHVMLLGSLDGVAPLNSERWFSYYDGDVFQRLCGPCAGTEPEDCTQCER